MGEQCPTLRPRGLQGQPGPITESVPALLGEVSVRPPHPRPGQSHAILGAAGHPGPLWPCCPPLASRASGPAHAMAGNVLPKAAPGTCHQQVDPWGAECGWGVHARAPHAIKITPVLRGQTHPRVSRSPLHWAHRSCTPATTAKGFSHQTVCPSIKDRDRLDSRPAAAHGPLYGLTWNPEPSANKVTGGRAGHSPITVAQKADSRMFFLSAMRPMSLCQNTCRAQVYTHRYTFLHMHPPTSLHTHECVHTEWTQAPRARCCGQSSSPSLTRSPTARVGGILTTAASPRRGPRPVSQLGFQILMKLFKSCF